MSVFSQGQLLGSQVAGQPLCCRFLSNTFCLWSELQFGVVQGVWSAAERFLSFFLLLKFQLRLFKVYHLMHKIVCHKKSFRCERKQIGSSFLNNDVHRESDSLRLYSGFPASLMLTIFHIPIFAVCQENQ